MAFPDDKLPLHVEFAFGANLQGRHADWEWTDLNVPHLGHAPRLLSEKITVVRGRQDETSQSQPSTATITLENDDGFLTPRNAMSPYYPSVGRGTPMRIWVEDETNYLMCCDSEGASTPDKASLDVTGGLWLAADVTVEDEGGINWLVSKWNTADNQRSYALTIEDGQICFRWSTNGTDENVVRAPRMPPHREDHRIRVGVSCNTAGVIWFYHRPQWSGAWTGFYRTINVFPGAYSSTAPLAVGTGLQGKVFHAEVRNGHTSGSTLVASPDFTAEPVSPAGHVFQDAQGNNWVVAPTSEIVNRNIRFTGQISEVTPTWPAGATPNDPEGGRSNVSITGSGVLRRLRQGSRDLKSPLHRVVMSSDHVSDIKGYWPLEGDADSFGFASPFPLGASKALVSTMQVASDDTLGGSLSLPTFSPNTSGGWRAPVKPYTGSGWVVECFTKIPTRGAYYTPLIQVDTTGKWQYWILSVSNTQLSVLWADWNANTFDNVVVAAPNMLGDRWYNVRLELTDTGATVTYRWRIREVDGTLSATGTGVVTAPSTGTVVNVYNYVSAAAVPPDGMSQGHVIVHRTRPNGWLAGADHGWTRETAMARIIRLADENDLVVASHGVVADSEAMGSQRSVDLMSLLSECADADQGQLLDHQTHVGLEYRSRSSFYNQEPVVLDSAANQVEDLVPSEDDQRMVNDVTVTNTTGEFHREADEESITSIGRYANTYPVSLASDDQLPNQAGWRLHTASCDEMRFPTVEMDLSRAGMIAKSYAIHAGTLVRVTNLPPQIPNADVDVIVQGYTETLSPDEWRIVMNCSPGHPWRVGILEDSTYGRVDTGGSALLGDLSTTQTTFAPFSGPWINDADHPTEFPFDIMMNGERMTVTSITGTAFPQTFTVVRSVNGVVKTHPALSRFVLADPLVLAL